METPGLHRPHHQGMSPTLVNLRTLLQTALTQVSLSGTETTHCVIQCVIVTQEVAEYIYKEVV